MALLVAGWALKVGWDVGARWLRWRGARDMQLALAAQESARGTTDLADDDAAAARVEKTKQEQAILNALADAIDQHNPGALLGKLVRVPGGLPPVVLEVLKNLPEKSFAQVPAPTTVTVASTSTTPAPVALPVDPSKPLV